MAEEKRALKSTTRTFQTAKGELTYAERSDLIAPKLKNLLDEIVDDKYSDRTLNEDLIQHFHKKIIDDIIPDIAGKWRTIPVMVGNWLPPEPHEISIRMHEYVLNLNERLKYANTLELQLETLAYAEGEFLHIHPFRDFNGRTARVILGYLLIRMELPWLDTSVKRETNEFKKYQNALAEYDNGKIPDLVEFWHTRLDLLN